MVPLVFLKRLIQVHNKNIYIYLVFDIRKSDKKISKLTSSTVNIILLVLQIFFYLSFFYLYYKILLFHRNFQNTNIFIFIKCSSFIAWTWMILSFNSTWCLDYKVHWNFCTLIHIKLYTNCPLDMIVQIYTV